MKIKNLNKKTKLKAFSMNEVLIVLVIVGILSTIAIVGFGDYVGEAYRLEAKSNLKAIKTRQDNYHMTKLEYSQDLNKIVDGIFKKGEKTLLLTIINNNNRRRYLGVKIN